MDTLIFEPQDTLFFRDGRPFNQGEGNGGVESLFPPSPLTLVGAARVAWARALGWPGRGKWSDDIRTKLGGDDNDKLKGLQFRGPLLFRDGEPIFPAPVCLIGKVADNSPIDVVRLTPASHPMCCDMGGIRLPVPDTNEADSVEGRKLLSGWWITQRGMNCVLEGEIPDANDWIQQKELWHLEPKVGIAIDPDRGTSSDGMLYSTQHVRLRPDVSLAMGIKGDLRNFPEQSQVPLGGEARSAWLGKTNLPLHSLAVMTKKHNGKLRYAVHVLTPLATESPLQSGKSFCGLPGSVVSACLPRAQRWGGWDSIERKPAAMKPHLPPGSVIFMEAQAGEKENVVNRHGNSLGNRGSWGFGLIAIGQWN